MAARQLTNFAAFLPLLAFVFFSFFSSPFSIFFSFVFFFNSAVRRTFPGLQFDPLAIGRCELDRVFTGFLFDRVFFFFGFCFVLSFRSRRKPLAEVSGCGEPVVKPNQRPSRRWEIEAEEEEEEEEEEEKEKKAKKHGTNETKSKKKGPIGIVYAAHINNRWPAKNTLLPPAKKTTTTTKHRIE